MKSLPGLEIPDQTNEPIGQHISQKELADFWNLTQGRISQLDREGVLKKTHQDGKKVYYNHRQATISYHKYLKGITDQDRLKEARIKNFEIRNDQLMGKLIDADEAAREWHNLFRNKMANLMGVASRISQALSLDAKDQARVTKMVKKALYEESKPIDQ